MTIDLLAAMLEGGPRYTNYFNGRILTAEDLRDDQGYHRERHDLLGRAIGTGIVEGLEVKVPAGANPNQAPVLNISPGAAINPAGTALVLGQPCDLRLIKSNGVGSPGTGVFHQCNQPDPSVTLTGIGAYILVMGPASGYHGKAPGANEEGKGTCAGCGSKSAVEGVYFNLIQLDLTPFFATNGAAANLAAYLNQPDPDGSLRNRLRNWIAHFCFGTDALYALSMSPLSWLDGSSSATGLSAIDELYKANAITAGEVPLAALVWGANGLVFCDMYPARQRPISGPLSSTFAPAFGSARRRLGEAVFQQFQNQLLGIPAATFPNIKIFDHFGYLPPLGILPPQVDRSGAFDGVEIDGPYPLSADAVIPAIYQSFEYLPFTAGKGVIRLYFVLSGFGPSVKTEPPDPPGGPTASGPNPNDPIPIDGAMIAGEIAQRVSGPNFSVQNLENPVLYDPGQPGRWGFWNKWFTDGAIAIDYTRTSGLPRPDIGGDLLYILFTTPIMPNLALRSRSQILIR